MLDALAALVDKSLVIVEASGDERRYRLLQSVREYGRERLREAGEEASVAERTRAITRASLPSSTAGVELEDEEWKQRFARRAGQVRAPIDWTIVRDTILQPESTLLAHIEWPEIIASPQEALRWYESALELEEAMPSHVDPRAIAAPLRHTKVVERRAGRRA